MIHVGNNLDILPTLPADHFDSIVTDPPYGLGFMGKEWDHSVPGEPFWAAMLRVAKPGAYLVAFGAPRLYHRMACAIEDAGWEIRDTLMWVYGSGFPKSRDVSDAMARRIAGQTLEASARAINPDVYRVTAFLREARNKAGWTNARIDALFGTHGMAGHWTTGASQPACPSVRQWEALKIALGFGDELDALVEQLASTERPEDWGEGGGSDGPFLAGLERNRNATPAGAWGTALKPAWEPIVMARKPIRGSVAANVIAYGTGALNIGGCRVGDVGGTRKADTSETTDSVNAYGNGLNGGGVEPINAGRWPSNLAHDGSDEVVALFPEEVVVPAGPQAPVQVTGCLFGSPEPDPEPVVPVAAPEGGSAARFFYCAKASSDDRHDGLEANIHPTVKPTALMRWLCRLVTPPGGHVLDPFTGSGSTGRGAIAEGFTFTGIELNPEYAAIAAARTQVVQPGLGL